MTLPAVQWRPSPNRSYGRSGYAIRAEVKHRIVGSLLSAVNVFADPARQASTHFGIGTLDGRLSVVQFVDLSDMAWGNGDVRDPSWTRIIPGVNPNLYTVSTEHEDGGAAGRGRITEAIWHASMELSALLRCGDVARIRAAGIRVRDAASAAQLAAMPIDAGSYIDHNQIAGPNKPYCLRRWLDDPGFTEGSPSRRDRLLRFLRDAAAEGNDMPTPDLHYVPQLWRARVNAPLREQASSSSAEVASIPAGSIVFTVGEASSSPVGWRLAVAGDPERLFYVERAHLDPLPPGARDPALYSGIATVVAARIEGKPVPVGASAEQLAAAKAAGRAEGIAAARADLADLR